MQDTDFASVDLNFDKLPYNENTFDLVTAFQVVEHLENPFLIAREVKRVLKPGGIFAFSVPNPYNLSFKIKYLFTDNMPPWTKENNHLLFLTKAVFGKTYGTEFILKEVIYQKGTVPFWGRFRKLFGSKKKHLKALPRSKNFARRVCYVLQKDGAR
ncbi:MAG: class I SAM-dependent methyltransferase [bacterium]|nr:class I SAM-dependent methyltransferase [bacterium]